MKQITLDEIMDEFVEEMEEIFVKNIRAGGYCGEDHGGRRRGSRRISCQRL